MTDGERKRCGGCRFGRERNDVGRYKVHCERHGVRFFADSGCMLWEAARELKPHVPPRIAGNRYPAAPLEDDVARQLRKVESETPLEDDDE